MAPTNRAIGLPPTPITIMILVLLLLFGGKCSLLCVMALVSPLTRKIEPLSLSHLLSIAPPPNLHSHEWVPSCCCCDSVCVVRSHPPP